MYFNYDNYLKLCDKIKKGEDPVDDASELKLICEHCLKYVNAVSASEKVFELIRFRYEADELIAKIEEADMNRRVIHNMAISNCNVLNRLASFYGVDHIFTGNVNDRYQVADFCMEVAVKIGNYRKNGD